MSWPIAKLKDVATFIRNGASIKQSPEASGLRITRIETIAERTVNLDKCGFANLSEDSHLDYRLEFGDILISHINSEKHLGKCAIFESDETDIVHGMNLLCFRRNDRVDARYLFRYLSSKRFLSQLPTITKKSVNQASFTVTNFKELEIPLPPLDEQKRIAAILDKADAIRQKRKQAIALADEFLRSVFLDMFGDPVTNPKGWEEPILSDIADVRSGVTKGKKLKEGTGITLPYMRVANVQDGYLDLSSIQTITVSEKDAEKCKLLRGDILLTEGGDPDKLGRGHVWNGEIDNCIHQNHIFSVRVKDEDYVRPAFLSAVIGSQRGKRYFLKVGKQTTGIATINKTVLSEFCPIVPPLELQDSYLKIASRIKRMQTRKHYHEVTLFPSLSQKAFSGQL
ncbi:restriction endonuclease subunit S [Vibrio cholerae]|uniref:restriction endonuclease subunit S n=1 Tax=Vibrio cholerae TaxID=666 RepID=UPI0011582DC9|nr:restriction endonuclease subunit S [Vibrio cholerae]MCD6722696.1 restriction endonuclease subunit S [Vibrio cholerae]TQP18117.1 restriction endonuclease subunit S [Vibrio cholerae]TQP32661.1 restriction endonuclease subunit S [Vibrio cholerae]